MMAYLKLAGFLLMIVAGQICFKKAALGGAGLDNIFQSLLNKWLLAAFCIYGAATFIWVTILRTMPLSTAYPFIALGFLLVPLAGVLFFGEYLSATQWTGAVLIVVGIVMAGGAGVRSTGSAALKAIGPHPTFRAGRLH
jgi:undecaprenyl phosphate-alpha-L-ara4N flippase subunit ArnE